MLMLHGDFDQCYAKIKEDALDRDCSILIFVSTDVDSICSAKILLVTPLALFTSLHLQHS